MSNLLVSDQIAHMLFHVDAELRLNKQSQVSGKQIRGSALKGLLHKWARDQREMSRRDLILLLSGDTRNPNLKSLFTSLDLDDDGQRVRLVMAEWVGKNVRPPKD